MNTKEKIAQENNCEPSIDKSLTMRMLRKKNVKLIIQELAPMLLLVILSIFTVPAMFESLNKREVVILYITLFVVIIIGCISSYFLWIKNDEDIQNIEKEKAQLTINFNNKEFECITIIYSENEKIQTMNARIYISGYCANQLPVNEYTKKIKEFFKADEELQIKFFVLHNVPKKVLFECVFSSEINGNSIYLV